jgi:ubiquinone/menaquinone biosynthesis C-methylase UbiE
MQTGESIQGIFPATAMPDAAWWQALWPHPEKVLADIGITHLMHVVDLCCGDGLFTVPLVKMAGRLVAIDLDPTMVQLTRARVGIEDTTNCTFIVGNAYDLAELVAEPVDLVLIANTFHGVPDKERLAHAVAAVSKPRGRLSVINWHRQPRDETVVLGQPRGPKTEMRMEPADVAAAVESAGFELTRIAELPPYHYNAIFDRPTASTGHHHRQRKG